MGNTGVHFRPYKGLFLKTFRRTEIELFGHSKSLSEKGGRKRVKFMKKCLKFNKSTTSKMIAKELDAQKSVANNEDKDE